MFIVLVLLCLSVSCGGAKDKTDSGVAGAGTATLTWAAPERNADGTTLNDLAGFKIYYYGASSRTLALSVTTPPGNGLCGRHEGVTECTYTVKGLSPGVYYFRMTAYDRRGAESAYSNEVSKEIK